MAIVIVKNKVTKEDIKKASEEYGAYIKIVIDIETGAMAIGGEWHADAEKELFFELIEASGAEKLNLVTPPGVEPGFSG